MLGHICCQDLWKPRGRFSRELCFEQKKKDPLKPSCNKLLTLFSHGISILSVLQIAVRRGGNYQLLFS